MTVTKAVVLVSGGQDSVTCLYWAMLRFGEGNVLPLSFDYGQRHGVELDVLQFHLNKFSLPWRLLPVDAFRVLGAAALTNDDIEVAADASLDVGGGNVWAEQRGLPSTFVPGRNMVFLGLAAAFAAQNGATHIVTGVCGQDAAGYPDCRPSFIATMETTLNFALGIEDARLPDYISIDTPLIDLDKADTFKLAADMGVLDVVLEHTHTCYEGTRTKRHKWGYGCGVCPACLERSKGYHRYLEQHGTPVA